LFDKSSESLVAQGHIDSIVDNVVTGWIWVPELPSVRSTVRLFLSDLVVAEVVADKFRPDLQRAGIGDGSFGFAIELPSTDGQLDLSSLSLVDLETGTQFTVDDGTVIANLKRDRVVGYIDTVIDGVLSGWAYRPDAPDMKCRLNVLVNDVHVIEVVADQFREDLLGEGVGDGCHAFSAMLPAELIPDTGSSVSVVDVITGTSLKKKYLEHWESQRFLMKKKFEPHDLFLLFDTSYYESQVGHIDAGLDHYRENGWREGIDPHPMFSTTYYIELYGQEVSDDPLTHFFREGRWKNYETHPLFDCQLYLRRNADIGRSGDHPLLHYLKEGSKAGGIASEFFDEVYYTDRNPGLREIGFIPIVHYLTFGWREGRRPHPEFDPKVFGSLASAPKATDPFTYFVADVLRQKRHSVASSGSSVPKVSILILNLGKWLITLQCLYFLRLHTSANDFEVVILDNGSMADKFANLCRFSSNAKIVRLDANRGFGEGNNIAADYAAGEFVLFLNNDAFVTKDWLAPLLRAFEADDSVGAAGPKFLYPDGRLQEAGALMSPCGTAIQRGKHLDGRFGMYDTPDHAVVDYISAATLLMKADVFRQVLGFDLCWDPAYYEDADLCLKLRLLGLKTVYVPQSVVVHIENGTSSDQQLDLRLHDIVAINRIKFVGRWGRYLTGESSGDEERQLVQSDWSFVDRSELPKLGLYTPYPLTPGGGERYLLTIASELRDQFSSVLVTPERYSRIRLMTIARELGLDLRSTHLATLDEARAQTQFDVFIAMGNEVLPPVHGMGRLNLFHCQFPFPLEQGHYVHHWTKRATYDSYVVNSEFTKSHLVKAQMKLGFELKNIFVLNPPVPSVLGPINKSRDDKDSGIILNVGRFAPGGHCKRQDVMIETFRRLRGGRGRKLELHLAGSLGADSASRQYLAALQEAARGLPVYFHVNVTQSQIHELYRKATVYWHLTGIGSNPETEPQLFEHFGITICEAMSAGVIPIVLRYGGPSEIITSGQNGFLVGNAEELLARTLRVLSLDNSSITDLAENAASRAAYFSQRGFGQKLSRYINERSSLRGS